MIEVVRMRVGELVGLTGHSKAFEQETVYKWSGVTHPPLIDIISGFLTGEAVSQ